MACCKWFAASWTCCNFQGYSCWIVVRTVVFCCLCTLKLMSCKTRLRNFFTKHRCTYGMRYTVSCQCDYTFQQIRWHRKHEFVLFVGVVVTVELNRKPPCAFLRSYNESGFLRYNKVYVSPLIFGVFVLSLYVPPGAAPIQIRVAVNANLWVPNLNWS